MPEIIGIEANPDQEKFEKIWALYNAYCALIEERERAKEEMNAAYGKPEYAEANKKYFSFDHQIRSAEKELEAKVAQCERITDMIDAKIAELEKTALEKQGKQSRFYSDSVDAEIKRLAHERGMQGYQLRRQLREDATMRFGDIGLDAVLDQSRQMQREADEARRDVEKFKQLKELVSKKNTSVPGYYDGSTQPGADTFGE